MLKRPHSNRHPIVICILAGGRSSRMGQEKTRLRLGNRTFLGHVKAAAAATELPVRVLKRDIVPRCGPIGGIYTALVATRADAVLFLACDMPFVSTALILRVLAAHKRTGRPVFVESQARKGFPCIIPKSRLETVEGQIARKERSLQQLSLTLDARAIRLPGKCAFEVLNINTPEDLAQARSLSWI